jgi:hypothetical protein
MLTGLLHQVRVISREQRAGQIGLKPRDRHADNHDGD